MRIVRYSLQIQQYQQLQPLWPGKVLSVGVGGVTLDGDRRIDMWCMDNDENRGHRLPPVLGVWIIGTGEPIPQAMHDADALFHGTIDLTDINRGTWHVFTAVVGYATTTPEPLGELSSIDQMVERIKERHAGGR